MILSGLKIRDEVRAGRIVISDFDERRLNPNSYNLRLAKELIVYNNRDLDMEKNNPYSRQIIPCSGLRMIPGKLYLARTIERTQTDYYVPLLEGRSSVGRLGINIHSTAGFGDIGFDGFWTLELSCVQPVWIYPGVEICQIYYHTIDGDYELYKNGKYQHNNGVQTSMLWKDLKKGK